MSGTCPRTDSEVPQPLPSPNGGSPPHTTRGSQPNPTTPRHQQQHQGLDGPKKKYIPPLKEPDFIFQGRSYCQPEQGYSSTSSSGRGASRDRQLSSRDQGPSCSSGSHHSGASDSNRSRPFHRSAHDQRPSSRDVDKQQGPLLHPLSSTTTESQPSTSSSRTTSDKDSPLFRVTHNALEPLLPTPNAPVPTISGPPTQGWTEVIAEGNHEGSHTNPGE